MPVNYGGINFSDFLKSMQEKCRHPEDERGELSDGAVICMCCGKVLKENGLFED